MKEAFGFHLKNRAPQSNRVVPVRSLFRYLGFLLLALSDAEYRQYSQHESKQFRRFTSNGRELFLLVYVVEYHKCNQKW